MIKSESFFADWGLLNFFGTKWTDSIEGCYEQFSGYDPKRNI